MNSNAGALVCVARDEFVGPRARQRGWRGAESRRSRTRRLNVCIVGSSLARFGISNYLGTSEKWDSNFYHSKNSNVKKSLFHPTSLPLSQPFYYENRQNVARLIEMEYDVAAENQRSSAGNFGYIETRGVLARRSKLEISWGQLCKLHEGKAKNIVNGKLLNFNCWQEIIRLIILRQTKCVIRSSIIISSLQII
ncbi:hypothetical protein PUN28_014237 [Cardiocondyla obscurior]|uniref:Uncharacterized protein n=1 Tax=Cardiocondyla obscurior TaxID=286306 RepID=A0AAW2F316_9HYME